MARPKKTAEERRDFIVSFRCTATEMTRLTDRAEKARQPVNQFARASALKGRVKVVEEQRLDFDTRHQLRAIGNNLNQIAHAMNAHHPIDREEVEETLAALNHVLAEVVPR